MTMRAKTKQDIVTRVIHDTIYLVPTTGKISQEGSIVTLNSTGKAIWEHISALPSFTKNDLISFLEAKHGEISSIKDDVEEFYQFMFNNELIITI